ncbi:MAG: hypothetical protein JSR96_11260 [Proteobacteria bacterium]|nr:hypothetical protein [Pseudomonadota bacterium]
MNDADAKREQLRARVAASQERLKDEAGDDDASTPAIAPHRANLPDAYPPEDYRSLVAEYPWLAVAAGAGAGLLIGALLPRRFGGRLSQRALTAATIAGELGLAISKRARDVTIEAGHEGLTRASTASAPLRRETARLAGATTRSARNAGLALAKQAMKLAGRSRK